MTRRVSWLALSVIAAGCSAVLPLGSEFTFGQDGGAQDGGTQRQDAAAEDAQVPDGGSCEPVTMDEACTGRCGERVICDQTFVCGACPGALTCAADNHCACEAPPCALWSQAHGDVATQKVAAIAVDSDGNLFVAGDFEGTITLGSDTYTNVGTRWPDMFIAKYDPRGGILWSKHIGDTDGVDNSQNVRDIAVDAAGNVVLVGVATGTVDLGGAPRSTDGDIVLLKLDANGQHVFSDVYGNDFAPRPVSLAIHPSSHEIYLAGHFWGTLRFGTTTTMTAAGDQAYFDLFVVRFDAAGTPLRARSYGDGLDQIEPRIAVTVTDLFMAAVFQGELDFGSTTDSLITAGDYETAIAKLGATGISTFRDVWSKQASGYLAAMAATPDGDVYLGGAFQGDLDLVDPPLRSDESAAFIGKLDSDGASQWAQAYPDTRLDDVAVGLDGALYVAGRVYGAVDFGGGPRDYSGPGPDAFIACFDADGTHRWSRAFASAGDQAAHAIAVGGSSVWVGATFEGSLDLGAGPHVTAGGTDVVFARLAE